MDLRGPEISKIRRVLVQIQPRVRVQLEYAEPIRAGQRDRGNLSEKWNAGIFSFCIGSPVVLVRADTIVSVGISFYALALTAAGKLLVEVVAKAFL